MVTSPDRPDASPFRTGLCDALALELHELTGLQLGLWRGYFPDDQGEPGDEAYEDCHAAVVVSFDPPRWLDVDGLHEGMPDLRFNEDVTRVSLVSASELEVSEAFSSDDAAMEEGLALARAFIESDALLQEAISPWRGQAAAPGGP